MLMNSDPRMAASYSRRRALGASAAVNGMVAYSILLNPTARILLFFVIPVPAWAFGTFVIGKDLIGIANPNSSIGHVAHVAGAAVGGLAFLATRGRLR